MKVFVTGATGAIGKPLVRQLVERGHSVVGTSRSDDRAAQLWDLGAKPVVLDVLDRDAVMGAVAEAQPDAIIHQATALSGIDFRKFEQSFVQTNRLRTEGTDYLLAAAAQADVDHFIGQSFAASTYERVGGAVKSESDPLDPDPAPEARAIADAIKQLETVVTAVGGTVLRYGGFYGPGTGLEPGGDQLELIRKRRFPIVGKGRGVWSFIHIEDAAAATVAALETGATGIYNVTDDDPAPVAEWLPYLSRLAGAKRPWRVPVWLGRLLAGQQMVVLMDEVRGASNAKARRELGWQPRYASWRDGFAEMLSPSSTSSTTSTRQRASSPTSTNRSWSPS